MYPSMGPRLLTATACVAEFRISAFGDPGNIVPICRTVFLYIERSCTSASEGCQSGAPPANATSRRSGIGSQEFVCRGFAFAPIRTRGTAASVPHRGEEPRTNISGLKVVAHAAGRELLRQWLMRSASEHSGAVAEAQRDCLGRGVDMASQRPQSILRQALGWTGDADGGD
jgi:hypothetical protein